MNFRLNYRSNSRRRVWHRRRSAPVASCKLPCAEGYGRRAASRTARIAGRCLDKSKGRVRLTQARIGDTLHDGNGTRVAVVNAFTTVNRHTDAIVRAVDYQIVGSPERFRVYSDDVDDVARWTRV